MKNEPDERQPMGAGHASAMLRQGLRELRGALYPESNVAQQAEYGLYGTKTPGEVAESRRADEPAYDEHNHDEEPSVLEERLRQAEQQYEAPAMEARELDRE